MKIKLLIFLVMFILAVSGVFIFRTSQNPTISDSQNEPPAPCKPQENTEVFSRKNYFSKDDATKLLGKQVRNLKCGKIKCPVSSNRCLPVEIGEFGKVKGLKPRDGYTDYILIIEWDEPEKGRDSSFAEQGLDAYVTYLGNDQSYQFVD